VSRAAAAGRNSDAIVPQLEPEGFTCATHRSKKWRVERRILIPNHIFGEILPGFERIGPGVGKPRHAHFSAYVSVVLDGGYEQSGYLGRVRLEPGDVLVQPVLDRHESWPKPRKPPHLLRLAWTAETGLGGVYRPREIDQVIRTAERDPTEASGLLASLLPLIEPGPIAMHDWPDLLAQDLRSGPVRIGAWARDHGLSREAVSRGFARCWGVSPQGFAGELRARQAWLRSVAGTDRLADIAADLGFADQPHMTRAVSALTGLPPARWRRRNAAAGYPLSPL